MESGIHSHEKVMEFNVGLVVWILIRGCNILTLNSCIYAMFSLKFSLYSYIFINSLPIKPVSLCGPVVTMLDLWTNGPRFKSALSLGPCSNGCFIHFTHFPLLAAWLNMTYDVERAVKPESSIFRIQYKNIATDSHLCN